MADTSRPLAIPGIPAERFHRREAWQRSSQPVTGPRPTMEQWDTTPLHYTGGNNTPDGSNLAALFAFLRAIQKDYLKNRGYSIGYGFAVAETGDTVELRGYDIKNAANRGWNHRTGPILCLVDGANPLTRLQELAVEALMGEHNRRTGRTLDLVGHRDIGATACPGDGVYRQITSGIFQPFTPGNPVPPIVRRDEDMKYARDHIEVMDTRKNFGPFAAGTVFPCTMSGELGQPFENRRIEDAEVVMVRVAAKSAGDGYVGLWADGGDHENVAVNFRAGGWETDLFPLPLDPGGRFYLKCTGSPADVVINVVGAEFAEAA